MSQNIPFFSKLHSFPILLTIYAFIFTSSTAISQTLDDKINLLFQNVQKKNWSQVILDESELLNHFKNKNNLDYCDLLYVFATANLNLGNSYKALQQARENYYLTNENPSINIERTFRNTKFLGTLYKNNGQYQDAILYLSEASELGNKNYSNIDIKELISCDSELGFALYMNKNYETSIEIYTANLEKIQNTIGNNSQEYAFDLYLLAGVFAANGEFQKSTQNYQKVQSIFEMIFRVTDINYNLCFVHVARNYEALGGKQNLIYALDNYEKYISREKKNIQNIGFFRTYTSSAGICARELYSIFAYEEQKMDSASIFLSKAESIFNDLIQIEKGISDKIDTKEFEALSQLASIDQINGRHKEAIIKYKILYQYEISKSDKNRFNTLYYLSELIISYSILKNTKNAANCEVLITNEIASLLKEDPIKCYLVLNNLANYFNKSNKTLQEIETRIKLTQILKENNQIEKQKQLAVQHSLIAQAYDKIENGDSLFYHLQQTKVINSDIYGFNSYEYASAAVNHLLYFSKYPSANDYDRKMIALFNEIDKLIELRIVSESDKKQFLTSKHHFYQEKGDFALLLSLQRNNKEIENEDYDSDELMIRIYELENLYAAGQTYKAYYLAKDLLNEYPNMQRDYWMRFLRFYASLPYQAENNLNESYRLTKLSLDLHSDRHLWSTDSVFFKHYLTQVSHLSYILIAMNKVDEAIKLVEENITLARSILNVNDNSYYGLFYNLGILFYKKNQYSKAINAYTYARSLDEETNNTLDPLYLSSFKFLSYCYIPEGNFTKSDSLMMIYLQSELNVINKEIDAFSLQDLAYKKVDAINVISAFINYALLRYPENSQLLDEGINQWLLINDLEKKLAQRLKFKNENQELYNNHKKTEIEISQALQVPLDERGRRKIDLDSLKLELRKIETLIFQKERPSNKELTIDVIRNKLDSNTNYIIAIPYIHIPLESISGSEMKPDIGINSYLLVEIRHDSKNLHFTTIKNVENFEESTISDFRYYLENKENPNQLSTDIFDKYFKPIEKFCNTSKTYFCPAGIYNDIDLEAIFHPEKKKYLFELYNFKITQTTDINFTEERQVQFKSASLFGGIDYGNGKIKAEKINEKLKQNGVIGISIKTTTIHNNLTIENVTESFPAQKVGIIANDQILEINDTSIDLLTRDQNYYLSQIRGPINTNVKLKINRPSTDSTFITCVSRVPSFTAIPVIEYKQLDGTQLEIESISSILKSSGISVKTYTGSSAGERELKKLKSPNILHIATHAFFINPSAFGETSFVGVLPEEMFFSSNLCNGFVLADVNNFYYPEMTIDKENGFVNGLEISLLDLNETELAVISGCESGKSTHGIGESKSGFKEALFKAGVKNVILSDFVVDDKVTAEFFQLFYSHLCNEKTSLENAMRETKRHMLLKYNHPYYWTAFQLYSN